MTNWRNERRQCKISGRREEGVLQELLAPKCEEARCSFVGQARAELLNHTSQRQGRMAKVMEKCHLCEERLCKKRLLMHKSFYQVNPNRDSAN